MKIERNSLRPLRVAAAFTIAETVVAMAVLGIMFGSFFAGLSLSFSIVQSAREGMRATQILSEKMETIRLYTWDQITATNFQATFNPTANVSGVPGSGVSGVIYTGQVSVAVAPINNKESYAADVKAVTVSLKWRSGAILHQTEMTTFVSRYGMQNYITN